MKKYFTENNRKHIENLELSFGVVKKCAFAYKILHFPTQILNNSQFDWSKGRSSPSECHMAFKSLA